MTPYERRMLARARAQKIINQNRNNGNRAQNYKTVGGGASAPSSNKNQKSDNVFLRSLATYGDVKSDVLTGAIKGVEGVADLLIGLVGGIGGFFNDDFEKTMKDAVEYDFTGRVIGDHLEELFKDSYTNDNKVGEIVEGIASGVGQMLPSIAVTVATGGAGAPAAAAQMAGLITTGVSAAGNATESAYQQGADTWQGLGYGAVMGGIEAATEKIGGSVLGDASKLGGTVVGDWLIKSGKDAIVRKGIGKVAYNFASEGLEEVISDIAAPVAQSVFDVGSAREDYFGENAAEGWSEVIRGLPTTFVVGGGTGVVMQGLQSGISNIKSRDKGGSKYTSVVSDMTTIEDVMEAGEAVKRSSKATQTQVDEFETRVNERILDRIQNISYNIKRMSESERANTFEDAPILTEFLNEDGSVIEDFSETLRARIDTGRATNTTARVSELGRVTESTRKAVEQFNKQYRATHGEDSGAVIKLYEGRFTEGERKNFAEIARSIKGISDKSGEKLNIAIIESNSPDIKAFRDGNTVFITKDELASGEWDSSYVEEIGHFSQRSRSFGRLANYLAYGSTDAKTPAYAAANSGDVRFAVGKNNEPRPNDRSIYINDDREYAVLAKALASKNGNNPRPVEYAYTDKNFYIVKDNQYGEFTPILQIDIETNRKLIEIITKEIDSGTYKNATTFAEWVRLVQSRERSDDYHFGRTSRRETNVRADGLYGGESRSESRNTSSQNRRDQQSPSPYIKQVHSFTDVAGVKKHVVKMDGEYFIEGDGYSKHVSNVDLAVAKENERVIQRYARKYDRTVSWVKSRLAADSDFLKKEHRRGLRFALAETTDSDVSSDSRPEVANGSTLGDVFYEAREAVLNAEYGVTEDDIDSAWEKAQRGERLNEREQLAYDELTAKMVASVLGSRESINRIARDNSTFARRLLNKLRDQIDILRTTGEDRANLRRLRQAELYFEEAIEDKPGREEAREVARAVHKVSREAVRDYKKLRREYNALDESEREAWLKEHDMTAEDMQRGVLDGERERRTEKKTAEAVRFNIVNLDNGMQYVEATESQVITGDDPKQWARQAAKFINDVIRGGKDFVVKTTDGDYLTITRDTAYKAGSRNTVRNPDGTYRAMTDEEYRVKINAEIHINELAEVSRKNKRDIVQDTKQHRFAKDGFTYRTAYFKDFDGKYYRLTISVGENGSVSTVYNVGKIKEDTLPSGKINTTFRGSKANNISSVNIISQPDGKINSSDEKSSEKNSDKKVRFSLSDSDMTAEAVRFSVSESSDDIQTTYEQAIDEELLEFVGSVDGMKNINAISKRKYTIGKINGTHAKLIQKILFEELGIKIDVSDYTLNIDGSAIKHINEKHGANGTSDKSMQNKEDIARLGWAANNAERGGVLKTQTGEIDYSYHYKNRDGSPSPKIILEKNIGDSKFIVVECIPDTETKRIHIVSARKTKSGNGQVLNMESVDSPQPTSKTLLDYNATTNIIPQVDGKSNSSDEKSSEKNSDKKVRFSLSSDETIRKNAQNNRKRYYTKEDARAIMNAALMEQIQYDNSSSAKPFDDPYGVLNGKLRGKTLDTVVDELWRGFNKVKTGGELTLARKIADLIMQSAVAEDSLNGAELAEHAEVVNKLKSYIRKVDISNIRDEIRHKYDKRATGIMSRWGMRRGGVGMTPDVIAQELDELGFPIKSEHPADILFEMEDAYSKATKAINDRSTRLLRDILSPEEYRELRDDMVNDILDGYYKKGSRTKLARTIVKYQDKMSELTHKIDELKTQNKIEQERNELINEALDRIQKLRDVKDGAYKSCDEFKDERFRKSIGEITKINYRGTFMEARLRRIFDDLKDWYTDKNPLFEGQMAVYSPNIATYIEVLAEGEGDLDNNDLKMFIRVVEHLRATMENYNKVWKNGKYVDLRELVEDYVDNIHIAQNVKTGITSRFMQSGYMQSMGDPISLMRCADGYNENGFYTETFRELQRGAVDAAIEESKLLEKYREFFKKHKKYNERLEKHKIKVDNVDGGVTNGREEAREKLTADGRTESGNFESKSGTRTQNADRSRIQEVVGRTPQSIGESFGSSARSLGLNDKSIFSEDDFVRVEKGSHLYQIQQDIINEYGIQCHIINKNAWKEKGPKSSAGARGGIIYISENISEEFMPTIAPHESTHVMKQAKYQPYLDFVEKTSEMLDFSSSQIQKLIDYISEHCKIDFFSMQNRERLRYYDELNAAVYGWYKAGMIDNSDYNMEWLPEVFADFDSYIAKLDTIHEQFKKDNAERVKAEAETTAKPKTETTNSDSKTLQEIPLNLAISLYMTTKREQAWKTFLDWGFQMEIDGERYRFDPILKNFKVKRADIQLDPEFEERVRALGNLLYEQFSEEDKDFIKILEDTLNNDCTELKVDTDMKRLGYSNVYFGGYYYPIFRANVAKSIDIESFFEVMDRMSNLSMNKRLKVEASNELLILPVTEVFERHIKQVSMYSHLAIPVDNFNRIFNFNASRNVGKPISVKSESERLPFGREMNKYLFKLLKDIQGVPSGERDQKIYNNAVRRLRSGYAKYQLGANPKVWLTQFSSFFASTNILDLDSITKGFGVKNKADEVDKYCPLARLRNEDNVAAKAQSVLDKTSGKVGDILMKPIGKTDRFVITSLFGACQAQVEKNGGAKVGTEENKVAAGELLERVILETQQNTLATERSGAMRSGDELWKSFTMFSADSMKVFGRVIDSLGEVSIINRRLKTEILSADDRKKLESQLKQGKDKAKKSISALLSVSIFMAAIAWAFRALFRKEEEKETSESIRDVSVDAVGNLLGGLPLVRDVYSYFLEGYELDNFFIGSMNDLLDSTKATVELAGDIASGEDVSSREVASRVKKSLYATGQIFGIPTRNVYNYTTGIITRISPETGYEIDSKFYAKSYRADLAKAIEGGDEKMVATIAALMVNENVGGLTNETARQTLSELVGKGYDVIPKSIGREISYEGEEITLTGAQEDEAEQFYYEETNESVEALTTLPQYKKVSDEAKAKAVRFIYSTYYMAAIERVIGVEMRSKASLFAEVADMASLALVVAYASTLAADKDETGKSISGSKKRKLQVYVNSLNIPAAQKYIIMGYLGYSNLHGENVVRALINRSKLSAYERVFMLSLCGYSNALTESEQKRLAKMAS